jgi:hypothetical protein
VVSSVDGRANADALVRQLPRQRREVAPEAVSPLGQPVKKVRAAVRVSWREPPSVYASPDVVEADQPPPALAGTKHDGRHRRLSAGTRRERLRVAEARSPPHITDFQEE